MPSGATAQHMEDDMFLNEEEVTLNLVIELVCHFYTADIAWAWFGPLPTDLTGLANFRYELKDLLTDTNTIEEPSHRVFGSMPPPNVQLP